MLKASVALWWKWSLDFFKRQLRKTEVRPLCAHPLGKELSLPICQESNIYTATIRLSRQPGKKSNSFAWKYKTSHYEIRHRFPLTHFKNKSNLNISAAHLPSPSGFDSVADGSLSAQTTCLVSGAWSLKYLAQLSFSCSSSSRASSHPPLSFARAERPSVPRNVSIPALRGKNLQELSACPFPETNVSSPKSKSYNARKF